jgi:hypothetical protein
MSDLFGIGIPEDSSRFSGTKKNEEERSSRKRDSKKKKVQECE